jgi:hypothetical protein
MNVLFFHGSGNPEVDDGNFVPLRRLMDEGSLEAERAIAPILPKPDAPAAVIKERLLTRKTNSYGKHAEDMAEVLGYLETVEPLLRRGATFEIVTTIPLEAVVEKLLEHVKRTMV